MKALEKLLDACALRAAMVLALALMGKKNREIADILIVSLRTVDGECQKLTAHYCAMWDHNMMKVVLIKAMKEGMDKLLFHRFRNHPLIGPEIKKLQKLEKSLAMAD